MTINRKLLKQYRNRIEARIGFDDVIDILISKRIVDQKLYYNLYSSESNKSLTALFNWILQDDRVSGEFIDILQQILTETKQPIAEIVNKIVEKREEIRDVIVHAGLPHFPLNYVERTSQEIVIKKKIHDLRSESREILVIYGMTGIGKSCLINQILQDPLFVDISKRAIFWLNLSQHEDDESIVQAISELYSNAASLSTRVPVSIYQPSDLNSWKRALKLLFLDQNLRQAILVLDDVKCRKIVEAFHCCRMIVITQDKELVPPSDSVKFHQIVQGFSESESLELIKKSLNTDTPPPEAREIHKLCEGFPMLINMIGSFLHDSREEALSDNREIWKSIEAELPLLQSYKDEIVFMIRRNEEKLSEIYRTYFHDLAIFPQHVNIRPDILIELWEVSSYTLRQIMLSLANKSLIVSFYHNDLQSFVYSIHSLVYYYLVNNKNDDRTIELHRKLINIYDTKSNDVRFKNSANYILGYFGYHLKHAKLFDRFSIYFDLNFLEKKLKSVGSIDLLRDFEIYKDYITKSDPLLERKAEDYKKFLTNYSLYLHQFPESNIVQYALYNKKINSVFETGAEIAKNNPEALYFEVLLYCGETEQSTSIKLDQEVTAICCTDSTDIVIIGTNHGDIRIVNLKYGHFYKKFNGHSSKIINIRFSPDKKRFLSISDDGKLKLWRHNINDIDSPSNKQDLWLNPHTGRELEIIIEMEQKDDKILTASFPNITNKNNNYKIINDKHEILITGSKRGSIILWDINTRQKLMLTPVTGIPIIDIKFSTNNHEIIAARDKHIYFYKIGMNHLIYSKQLLDDIKINYLLKFTTNDQLIAVHNKYFNIWHENRTKSTVNFLNHIEIDDDLKIVCAKITPDDNYLILATNSFIYIYNLITKESFNIRNDFRLSILNLRIVQNVILLLGCNNLKLEEKRLQLQQEDRPVVKNPTQFTCYWREELPIYPILNRYNKINLFKGNVLLSEYDLLDNNYNMSENSEIVTSTFSLCGNYIFFGCKNGNLIEFKYKKKTLKTILKCNEEIRKIHCFNNDYTDNNYSYTSNDDKLGLLVISTKTKIILLENEPKEYNFINGIFDYFYINYELIVIDNCANITSLKNSKILFNCNENWSVMTADFDQDIFVITFNKNDEYFIKMFNYNQDDQILDERFCVVSKVIPTVSKISPNGKLLAIGSKDGSILLLNIDNLEITYLWLHKQPIQSLMFAPTLEPILVSLSDQIAFWNLKTFQNQSRNSTPTSSYNNFSVWCYKKTSDSTPYLLSALNLHGKLLRFVSASRDFLHFIVVDVDGNIYKLDVI